MRSLLALSTLRALAAADSYYPGEQAGGSEGASAGFTYCGGLCTISIQEFPIYWADIETTTFTDLSAFSSYVDSLSAAAASATNAANNVIQITPNEQPPPITIQTDATGSTTLTCCDDYVVHRYGVNQDGTCGAPATQTYVFAVPGDVTGTAADASILGTNPCKTLVETAAPGPPKTKTYYPYLVGPTSTAPPAAPSPAAAAPSPNNGPSGVGSGNAVPQASSNGESGQDTGSAIPSGQSGEGTGSAIQSGEGSGEGTGSAIPSGSGEGTGSAIPSGSDEGTGSAIPSGASSETGENGTGSASPSGSGEEGTGSAIPSGSEAPAGSSGSAAPPAPEVGTPTVVVPLPTPEGPSAPAATPETPVVPEANPGNASQPPQPSEVVSGSARNFELVSLLAGVGAGMLAAFVATII